MREGLGTGLEKYSLEFDPTLIVSLTVDTSASVNDLQKYPL